MFLAIKNAVLFFWFNATVKDARATHRHNWRWVFFVFFDFVFFSWFRRTTNRSGTVVVLVNRLGDAIVSKPLIDALCDFYSNEGEKFIVIGDKSWQVLADNIYRNIDTYFICERKFRLNFLYRLKVSLWIRRQNFKRAICFMHHRLEMRDDALVFLSGANERIVLELPFMIYRWYPWIFDVYMSCMTRVIPTAYKVSKTEIFDSNYDAIRRVPHVFERQCAFFKELTNEKVLKWHRIKVDNLNTKSYNPYVVLSFGASSLERCWPLDAYLNISSRLIASGYDVKFVGGPAELVYKKELLSLVSADRNLRPEKISVIINELSFDALMRLYVDAACLVGTDTGGSHLAMWLGVPLVTILQADRRLEAFERLGDFFPYPSDMLLAHYRAVWMNLDEFKFGGVASCDRVWLAIRSLLQEKEKVGTD